MGEILSFEIAHKKYARGLLRAAKARAYWKTGNLMLCGW